MKRSTAGALVYGPPTIGFAISAVIALSAILSVISAPYVQHQGIIVARYTDGSSFHFIVNENGTLSDRPVSSIDYYAGPVNGQLYNWSEKSQSTSLSFSFFIAPTVSGITIGFVLMLVTKEHIDEEETP